MIRWEQREDGIVILTLDDPAQSTNTMNSRYVASMQSTVERLEAERESITGVVVTSAKDTFLAGADLKELSAATDDAVRADGTARATATAVRAAWVRPPSRSSRRSRDTSAVWRSWAVPWLPR